MRQNWFLIIITKKSLGCNVFIQLVSILFDTVTMRYDVVIEFSPFQLQHHTVNLQLKKVRSKLEYKRLNASYYNAGYYNASYYFFKKKLLQRSCEFTSPFLKERSYYSEFTSFFKKNYYSYDFYSCLLIIKVSPSSNERVYELLQLF
jgi:hypothetical protein